MIAGSHVFYPMSPNVSGEALLEKKIRKLLGKPCLGAQSPVKKRLKKSPDKFLPQKISKLRAWDFGSGSVVVKPTIGAGSDGVSVVRCVGSSGDASRNANENDASWELRRMKLQAHRGPVDAILPSEGSSEQVFRAAIQRAQTVSRDVLLQAHLGYKLRNGQFSHVPPELKIFWWKGLPLLAMFPPIGIAEGVVWRRDFSFSPPRAGAPEDACSSSELHAGLLAALQNAGVELVASGVVNGVLGERELSKRSSEVACLLSFDQYHPSVWERLDIDSGDFGRKLQFEKMVQHLCSEIAPAFVRAVFGHERMKSDSHRTDLHTLIFGRTDFLLGRMEPQADIIPYFGEMQNFSGNMPGDCYFSEGRVMCRDSSAALIHDGLIHATLRVGEEGEDVGRIGRKD